MSYSNFSAKIFDQESSSLHVSRPTDVSLHLMLMGQNSKCHHQANPFWRQKRGLVSKLLKCSSSSKIRSCYNTLRIGSDESIWMVVLYCIPWFDSSIRFGKGDICVPRTTHWMDSIGISVTDLIGHDSTWAPLGFSQLSWFFGST